MDNDTFLLNWLLNTLDKPTFRELEYDKVQFSQYEVSIDDTNHIIYLAS